MGEAGDQLVEGQLAGRSAPCFPHPFGCFRQQTQQRQLALKHRFLTTCHHQQGALQRLRLAAQDRCFQVATTLAMHAILQSPRFGDPHRAHRHATDTGKIPEGSDHLCRHGSIPQHGDHGVAALGGLPQIGDRFCTCAKQGCGLLAAAVPNTKLDPLSQQAVANGLPQQTCSQQCNGGH